MLDKFVSFRRLIAACRAVPRSGAMAVAACLAMAGAALGAATLVSPDAVQAQSAGDTLRGYQGVASCAGSTCHGRSAADGAVVRQDEVLRWQEDSSPSGAHSRAWKVVQEPRGQAIVRRMGLDGAGVSANAPDATHHRALPAFPMALIARLATVLRAVGWPATTPSVPATPAM